MPRPRKPLKLKLIAGTVRPSDKKSKPVEFPLINEPPEPPDWLEDKNAKAEWNRLAPILIANGLLTECGLSALAVLCAMHGKIVGLWMNGESPTGFLLSQYRALMNDFGLTPSSQMRVTPIMPTKNNPFANNGKGKH